MGQGFETQNQAVLVQHETRLYVALPKKVSPEWPGFGEIFV